MSIISTLLQPNPLGSIFLSITFLLAIEILYFAFLKTKDKRIKERASYIFNWKFPLNRPFTLFSLPLLVIFLLQFLILKVELTALVIALWLFMQPLLEEIIFRGMVFGYLLKKYFKSEIKWNFKLFGLILIQALIFLVFHLLTTKNPIGVFLLGIVCGFLFVVAKNDVSLSAIVHIANNVLMFVIISL